MTNKELEKLKADSRRYQWIKENCTETLTENSLKGDFMIAEHKRQFEFPQLISWADFCGAINLDDAIDIKTGDYDES